MNAATGRAGRTASHDVPRPEQPATAAGRALLADYYANNDAREGAGYSLGERILAIEAEARADAAAIATAYGGRDGLREALDEWDALMARWEQSGQNARAAMESLRQARAALRQQEEGQRG